MNVIVGKVDSASVWQYLDNEEIGSAGQVPAYCSIKNTSSVNLEMHFILLFQ